MFLQPFFSTVLIKLVHSFQAFLNYIMLNLIPFSFPPYFYVIFLKPLNLTLGGKKLSMFESAKFSVSALQVMPHPVPPQMDSSPMSHPSPHSLRHTAESCPPPSRGSLSLAWLSEPVGGRSGVLLRYKLWEAGKGACDGEKSCPCRVPLIGRLTVVPDSLI